MFALDQEKADQAFLKQVGFLKYMDKLVRQQIMLVEAANATPYGWRVANHLEPEKERFSEQDKTHTKALWEADGFVRRDNWEFNGRTKDVKKRGGMRGISGRGFFNPKRGGYMPYPISRTNNSANKNLGVSAQQVAAKYNRS